MSQTPKSATLALLLALLAAALYATNAAAQAYPSKPVRMIIPVNGRKDMKVTLRYDGPLRAPIAAGQQVGTLTVTVPGKPDKIVPVVSAETIGGSGFLDNMMMGLQALIFGTKEA